MTFGKFENIKGVLVADEYNFVCSTIDAAKKDQFNLGDWVLDEKTKSKAILLANSNFTAKTFELHKQYKDLHYVIKGRDFLYLSDSSVCEIYREYSLVDDFSLYKGRELGKIEIQTDNFYLIECNELHSSLLDSNSVKIVFKLKSTGDEK
jgi:beta-galactosidase beta subunit